MFAFLKAPPDAAPISDKRELDARYRYWRRHILLTIWLGYALFYFTRKSFNAAVPEILASNVLTRSDIGLLATLFYITYGPVSYTHLDVYKRQALLCDHPAGPPVAENRRLYRVAA